VLSVVVFAALASVYALRSAPLDAIPDIADPQIVVYAKWQRAPAQLEREVARPIVRALSGIPGVASVRATSHMGYSFIYASLASTVSRAELRETIATRLSAMSRQLPPDANVALGPDAGSMGWVYQYALTDHTQSRDLRELRLINENIIAPQLRTVAGVAEVASVGGLEKQYQVRLFPPLLDQYGITLTQVCNTLRTAFDEVGGRVIEVANRDYQVRGVLKDGSVDHLEKLVVGRMTGGRAVLLSDVGFIEVGYDLRRSIADLNGAGEVVGAIVVVAQDSNVLAVTQGIEHALTRAKASLPEGVEIVTTYNRSTLIWDTLKNFITTLAYELAVVVIVILIFLRNLRTAMAPIAVLLLATLFTALPLAAFGQTINLLSLAGLAIAIGEMVDASIVIVENCTAELAAHGGETTAEERREIIVRSIANVAPPLLYSLLIILASFLPIFFLGEREARLFDALAFTKTFAMAFSTLLTLAVLPIVIVWVLGRSPIRTGTARENTGVRLYRACLRGAIRWRYAVLAVSLLASLPALLAAHNLRRDYMPELEEGSILYMPTTLPGLPSRDAGWVLQQMDRKLEAIPEVASVFGKLGRADTATDSAPVTMIETTILLRPRSAWRPGLTREELVLEMDAALKITGYVNSWTQPIAARVLMQDTGIQTAVGVKVRGPDVRRVEELAREIEGVLRELPGTSSVIAERISDGYFVDAEYDLARLATAGVALEDVNATMRYGVSGENLLTLRDADGATIPLSVQYAPEYTDSIQKLRTLPVVTRDGRTIALGEVADVAVERLPEMLRNDNGQLAAYVYVYVNSMSAPEYVNRARTHLAERIALPPGYSVEWTGTYQFEQQARARLAVVVPVTLVIILGLLLLAFRSLATSLLVMLSVPFALIGGVLLQWWLGFPLTTAVIIGYVALFAVAIQTGIIMIVFIRQALERRAVETSFVDAVIEGSAARLRPKLMTVAATALSLLPIMFAHEQGMELAQPIATPTIGGMATSVIYVLVLLPCLYVIGEDLRRHLDARRARSTQ
jgi:Cu(I)/Ag(I) efflux system membrane protein CusA/SilA